MAKETVEQKLKKISKPSPSNGWKEKVRKRIKDKQQEQENRDVIESNREVTGSCNGQTLFKSFDWD